MFYVSFHRTLHAMTQAVTDTQTETPLPPDVEDVRRTLMQLVSEDKTQELIELVVALLLRVRHENSLLTARLHHALKRLYGRTSEKVDVGQLQLLFEALRAEDTPVPPSAVALLQEAAQDAEAGGTVPQPEMPPKKPSRKGQHPGRSPLPAHLPREEKVLPVPEAQRVCATCGALKTCIGHVVSEVLEFVPAQLKVIEEKREKLACQPCAEGVVVAPSEKVMDKGRPGPGLLAYLIVDKFWDAMPLYRQAQAFSRVEVPLSDATLGDWVRFGLDVVAPLAARIAQLVVADSYLGADDTGLCVLDKQHPKGSKKGHIWVYVGMTVKLTAFAYTPTWQAIGPKTFLQGFAGYLQGDGYAGYDGALAVEGGAALGLPEERRLGCGMHIRRRFEKAADAGDLRGGIALAYFKKIYAIEADCKARQLTHAERHQVRQEKSIPIVNDFYQWVHALHPHLVPKTPLFEATRYARNEEDAWRLCFTQGHFEIDNGEPERQLRRVATGRKNFLFAGSDAGAHRIATAYTLLASCILHDVNPWAYLTDVIAKLQAGWPQSRIDELLPHLWKPPSVTPAQPLPPTSSA
jgi:transposase